MIRLLYIGHAPFFFESGLLQSLKHDVPREVGKRERKKKRQVVISVTVSAASQDKVMPQLTHDWIAQSEIRIWQMYGRRISREENSEKNWFASRDGARKLANRQRTLPLKTAVF